MLRLLLAVLSAFAWQSALAQSHGRVLAYPNPLDDPDAPEVIDLKIVQAVAFPNSSGHLELYLLPVTVPVDDLGQALLPIQYYRRRIDALDLVWVSATVRPADGTASASLHRGPHYGPDLGPGVLVGGRVEDGRLRGRMLVISAFKGRFLVDVSVDAPIISPAAAQALPADGGEPWQALLRLRSALAAGDEAGVLGALVPSLAQDIAGDFQADMPTLRAQFPMDPPLEQGWLTDVDARLVLLDESGAEPVRVMVDMARYQAGWRLQVISYRPHGRAIQPTELESFPPPSGADESPLETGIAISTELHLEGLSIRPRHAIALPVPDRENEHLTLLSEAPLPTEHLALVFSGESLAPLFPDGEIRAVTIFTRTEPNGDKSTDVAETGIFRLGQDGELVVDPVRLGSPRTALIDGVIYCIIQSDKHQLRFAAPVHSTHPVR